MWHRQVVKVPLRQIREGGTAAALPLIVCGYGVQCVCDVGSKVPSRLRSHQTLVDTHRSPVPGTAAEELHDCGESSTQRVDATLSHLLYVTSLWSHRCQGRLRKSCSSAQTLTTFAKRRATPLPPAVCTPIPCLLDDSAAAAAAAAAAVPWSPPLLRTTRAHHLPSLCCRPTRSVKRYATCARSTPRATTAALPSVLPRVRTSCVPPPLHTPRTAALQPRSRASATAPCRHATVPRFEPSGAGPCADGGPSADHRRHHRAGELSWLTAAIPMENPC